MKQIQEKYDISRRAIQGYEVAHLLSASFKNERGTLMYDEKAVLRIVRIRQMQQFGFSLKEIKEVIDAPNPILKEELIKKARLLYEKNKNLEKTIHEIEKLIESL